MSETENQPDAAEQMRYVVAGGEADDPDAALEKYTGAVDWSYLKPHFENGLLLYVDRELSITEVGRALGDDDSAQVERWLKNGDLVQPGPPHAAHWEKSGARFTALVVSPFVLIQELGAEREG